MLLHHSEREKACLLTSVSIMQGDSWGTEGDYTAPKAPVRLHDIGGLPLTVYFLEASLSKEIKVTQGSKLFFLPLKVIITLRIYGYVERPSEFALIPSSDYIYTAKYCLEKKVNFK